MEIVHLAKMHLGLMKHSLFATFFAITVYCKCLLGIVPNI